MIFQKRILVSGVRNQILRLMVNTIYEIHIDDKFFIVIARYVSDWIMEHFLHFLVLCKSMREFSYIVVITIATITQAILLS